MSGIKVGHLIDNELGEEWLGSDRARVIKQPVAQVVWVLSENVRLACGGACFPIDTEEYGDVLKGVETVCDKKRNHYDMGLSRELIPVGDPRSFFHISAQHFGVDTPLTDTIHLPLCCQSGIIVEAGAVSHNEQADLSRRNAGGDLSGAVQEKLGHAVVASDRVTIFDRLVLDNADWTLDFQLTGNNGAGKVTFADEIGDDIDFVAIDHVQHLAKARFLFPESAVDLPEEPLPPYGFRMSEGR